METAPAYPVTALSDVAAGQRGLKRGLAGRERTVIRLLDETIIPATPPRYAGDGRLGEQVCVPVTGTPARRILHGVRNIHSGDLLWRSTAEWVHETQQAFLAMLRAPWRGWNSGLFEDRGSPPTATDSLGRAPDLHIERRVLPTATPELNAMDHLWRHVNGRGLANRTPPSIAAAADSAWRDWRALSSRARRRQAGGVSGNAWFPTSRCWPRNG